MKRWMSKIGLFVCLLAFSSLTLADDTSDIRLKIADEVHRLIHQVNPDMKVGITVLSLDDGQILYQLNANDSFIPASNLKLFTAESALLDNKLGPDFRFHTKILYNAGNIYFVFDGDPTLTSDDILHMVAQARAILSRDNIHSVHNVYIDNSKYNQDNWGAGWMIHGDYACYAAPSNAIEINRNCAGGGAIRHLFSYAQGVLRSDFRREGIHVRGGFIAGVTPDSARLLVNHDSDTLAVIMHHMLKVSDNAYANSILKKIGQEASGEPGGFTNGISAEKSILNQDLGLDTQDLSLYDGSGLSRYTKVSPSDVVKLLSFAHTQDTFHYFYNALPVSGKDGTLARRMWNIRGKVHAKTGSMSGVSSLSGYVLTANDRLLAFSIIINNFAGGAAPYHHFQDALVTYLSKLRVA